MDSDKISAKLFDEAFLKKIEYLYIMSKRMFVGKLRSERKTRKAASGIEFADHRNYAPGDDVKSLDWRVYARTEKLLLRLFEEEEDLYFYFLIDCSTSMQLGSPTKLDYAKRVLAALAYIGLSNMDRVSIIPFNSQLEQRLAPSRGKGQIFKIFQFLSAVQAGGQTSLLDACRSFSAQTRRRGVAVVLSDFYSPEGFQTGLSALLYQQFECYAIQIADEAELSANLRGDLELIDVESGERRQVTVTPRLMQRYRDAHKRLSNELAEFCTKRGMLYFHAPTSLPFEELILKIFRSGGFLK
ncbi:MAG: DUF58 domain-containing protein [Bradymonadales bacterium]|jgi:uncharacterized protein (DUF58 family)